MLQFSALFGIINSEVTDKAGGRTDILVSFGAVQFNVECKTEDDASETGLREYVAQATECQNTNVGFAILLALDKNRRRRRRRQPLRQHLDRTRPTPR